MAERPATRPNRWTGPPSTWRSHTKNERVTASSLDTIRSQDLSIHLYNAHAIRVRAERNRKGKSKSSAEDGTDFVPPMVWTLWPMPVEEVPRDPYLPNVGGRECWRMTEDVRPSASLEDALLSTTTRIARERWRARRWEWKAEKIEGADAEEMVMSDMGSPSELPAKIDGEESLPTRPMFSSQAADALGINSPSSEEDKDDIKSGVEIENRPVPLADDDQARRILLPSIRHIISKADDLLEGLQKAREAYAGNWNKSRTEDTTTGEDTDTGAEISRSRARSKSRQSRSGQRPTSTGSDRSLRSVGSSSSRQRSGASKMRHPKPRDWSDVLGMAALTGWDADVIQRAAERCSRLFSEDMVFRTFEEGQKGEKSSFAEYLASGDRPSPADDEEGTEMSQEKPRNRVKDEENRSSSPQMYDLAIRCPITTCPKHRKGFTRAKVMYDHVRRDHPDVDIKELKKLEAKRRGDQRGRWDRNEKKRSSSVASFSNT